MNSICYYSLGDTQRTSAVERWEDRVPYRLIRYGLSAKHPDERMFRERPELKESSDVVIVGAGGNGLAAAYYLARDHGLTDAALLGKS